MKFSKTLGKIVFGLSWYRPAQSAFKTLGLLVRLPLKLQIKISGLIQDNLKYEPNGLSDITSWWTKFVNNICVHFSLTT